MTEKCENQREESDSPKVLQRLGNIAQWQHNVYNTIEPFSTGTEMAAQVDVNHATK